MIENFIPFNVYNATNLKTKKKTIDIEAHYEKRKHLWMKKIGNDAK